jgi:magnesium chelatase family protein
MEEKTKTKKINSAIFDIDTKIVEVETTFIKSIPSFSIVGLASNAVQESKERVKSALLNNDFEFPPLKIVTNLSPANLPKKSTALDLPIALSILFQNKNIDFSEYLVLGELGLDGTIKETIDMFAVVLGSGFKKIIAPLSIAEKLAQIPDIEVFGFQNLNQFFNLKLTPIKPKKLNYKFIEIDSKKYFYNPKFELDFKDVKGQQIAKRVALISASGMHNILLNGSAGVGKSMIINRLKYILPPVSFQELLEIEKQNSLDNKKITFNPQRPFRYPHHNSSKSAIFGGRNKIGEIALANNGILFFDELPQFKKDILEDLRLPLQEGKVLISRVNSKIEYKTDILFASAMNPCPCGNLLSNHKECKCSEREIQKYKNRISEPLIDRIDLYLELREDNDNSTITSKEMYQKVLLAFEKQMKRGYFNSKLPENWNFEIEKEGKEILEKAKENFGLSKRSEFKILKVAQTISDLENYDKINKKAILEALSYRKR